MKIQVAQYEFSGSLILIALVDSKFVSPEMAVEMIARVELHYPTQAIMLVSIESNGFKAFSFFQSHKILALLQLEKLEFTYLDLSFSPREPDLPF